MFEKQVFKNWLRYLLCFITLVCGCFLLSSIPSIFFSKQLSNQVLEWITFLFVLVGFLSNILISIFKLKKKYPIPRGFFWFYISIQVWFCIGALIMILQFYFSKKFSILLLKPKIISEKSLSVHDIHRRRLFMIANSQNYQISGTTMIHSHLSVQHSKKSK